MKYLFYIITLISLSCTNNNFFKGENIIVKTFPVNTSLAGEKLNINSIGINDIFIIDTFLVCFNAQGIDHFFNVYSTNTLKHAGNCLTRGRGPNEFISIQYNGQYTRDTSGICVWLKEDATLKMSLLNLTESLKQGKTIIDSCIHLNRTQEGYGFILNDTLINIELFPSNAYFKTNQLTTDSISSPIKMFHNPYPNESYLNQIFAMTTAIRPDNKKFASAMIYFNQINIYSSDFKTHASLSIYEPTIPIKTVINTTNNLRNFYFSQVIATSKAIYGLYINQPDPLWDKHNGQVEIQSFDWNGNPIQKFTINENIIYFALDEKHECLYGINSNEEIYKYDIQDFI